MTQPHQTVFFWGAGATASLGLKTTDLQTKALHQLARRTEKSLCQRIAEALGDKASEPWQSALRDLLIILGDEHDGDDPLSRTPTQDQIEAMRRNWRSNGGQPDDVLRHRIFHLRTLYDWPALKAVIDVCPGVENGNAFNIVDLFNVLDMHGQSGHGFRVQAGAAKVSEFLTPQRVLGARNALKMLLLTFFYIDWYYGTTRHRRDLDWHYDFAKVLGRRMQQRGLELAGRECFDNREFYQGDVAFVSMNYDPVALWCQFVANRDLNRSPPCVGCPARKLQIFHDLGHFVAGSRVKLKDRNKNTPWHPMNESAAQRLNDADHGAGDRIRISKFLLPHGCLWWRECPDCGKLSSYMGNSWRRSSPTLIPPPPLKSFVQCDSFEARSKEESDAWSHGEVDARACVHCGTLTYAHHTQITMQSNFKSPPPPFLEEIKRDLRVAVQNADHIILMGYSLPPDDVDYRAFIAARRQRKADRPVKCSVVVGKDHGSHWSPASEWVPKLPNMVPSEPPRTTLETARDLFGKENVRFYGGGIPNVFLEGGTVTDAAVERLLDWESTSHPPSRHL